MKTRSLFCLLSALLATCSFADTSVWKVSKGNHHLYMGGTVHVLSKADYPLPSSYEKAYQLSHRVILETDLEKLQSPAFQKRMLEQLSYADGVGLEDVLSEKTFRMLEQYCVERGISLASIVRFKPGMVTSVLLLIELERLGLAGEGVDAFFHAKALADDKQLGKLETAEAQLEFMAAMGEGQEDEMIEYALGDIVNISTLMKSLKKAWRKGDMQSLQAIALEPYLEQFAEVFDDLLIKRNNAWVPKIESMLDSTEIEFVLVGVLHFAGEQGLLAQLKTLGYKVEQL